MERDHYKNVVDLVWNCRCRYPVPVHFIYIAINLSSKRKLWIIKNLKELLCSVLARKSIFTVKFWLTYFVGIENASNFSIYRCLSIWKTDFALYFMLTREYHKNSSTPIPREAIQAEGTTNRALYEIVIFDLFKWILFER